MMGFANAWVTKTYFFFYREEGALSKLKQRSTERYYNKGKITKCTVFLKLTL